MVDNVRDFLRKDRFSNFQLSYESPSSCGDDGNCSFGFVCVDGRCVPSNSSSQNSDCPSSPVGGSGCEGCDPSCSNGIVWVDENGDKQCRPGKDCGPQNPCPSGTSCHNGFCQEIQCNNGGGCSPGLVCCAGICKANCTGQQGDPCSGNFDCVGNNVCISQICTPDPYQDDNQVPWPVDGKSCDPACDTFFKEFGYHDTSIGCDTTRRCGYCQECVLGSCRPYNPNSRFTPCGCKPVPQCQKCVGDGEFVEDCGCSDCTQVSNARCSCGIVLKGPIRACRGACESGLVSSSLLRNKVAKICQSVCGSQNPADQCKGQCQTVSTSCTGFSCPPGYNCKLTGRIEVGGDAVCVYENCDPSRRPAFCDNEESLETILSVSVIDEDDNYPRGTKNSNWAAFRASYPTRPFYVLAPGGSVSPPAGWNGGSYSVARMPGVSNWFSLLSGPLANARAVLLWIDNSGSMTTATVSGSLSLFRQNCQAAGIAVCTKSGSTENWIAPHITSGTWCG